MSDTKAKKTRTAAPAEAPGRPSTFTQEIADRICARLATGQSLRAICRDDESMPPEATVRLWVIEDRQGFSAQYARAREIGYESMADELIEIADTPRIGTKSVSKASGIEITEADMIEHRRLQVDTRKWMLAKMLPKRYGDKLAIGGADDLPPIKTMTDEELDAAIAKAAAAANGSHE